MLKKAVDTPPRPAYYCSGCPHNTSTKVPEGSLALAGIGCHVMATAIYPDHNKTTCQMGGEGATWIGQAPFSKLPHVFANLGDGTYFHSGHLAIRAAVAAKVNITYKILYNDAVAMTGGQPVDGQISVRADRAADGGRRRQAHRRGDRGSGALRGPLATARRWSRCTIARDMDAVQRELREVPGVIGADLRPDLCRGEAPPAQEGRVSQGERNAYSSTKPCAKAAAIAACSPTAPRSCRSKPSSAASARSTSRPATRITRASKASVRVS